MCLGRPEATQALVSGLVHDALAVLAAVAEVELDGERAEAVALVAGQAVEPGERPGCWRIARRVAQDRVISVVDPQARHARKTSAHNAMATRATSPPSPSPGW